jgi:phosphoglycolate phosphatase-like HAD superfamily hydrolase
LASAPDLLVLDFDGVVCDGMEEFFETAWRAWQSLDGDRLPMVRRGELGARFAKLRPVVEAGWEMALLPALLATTDSARDAELASAARWPAIRDAWVRERGLAPQRLADALDEARDVWRREDRDGWLRRHRFYPGIADLLRDLAARGRLVYVLSTKDKRFLDDLFAWQKVPLPTDRIVGKATPRRPKWEGIEELAARHALPASGAGVWFVEDRLATLIDVQSAAPHLAAARLFLAEWGYVFADNRDRARAHAITPLTLAQAIAPFEGWLDHAK